MRFNKPVTRTEYNYGNDVEIISTTDLKGIVTSANEDFMQISGFDDNEVIGKQHNVVRHPDMPPEAFDMLWTQLKAGKPWVGLVKNRCKNGDYYWVDAYVCPQYEGDQIIGFQSVRTKPKKDWVKRADKLYTKVMAGKSEHDKKTSKMDNVSLPKYPLGITGKFLTAFFIAVAPVMAGMWLTGQVSLISVLAGLAVSLGLGFAGIRYLLAPILELAKESKGFHDDILAQYVYTGSTDEIGQIQFGQIFLQAKVRTVVGRIKESADVLNKSASEIARGNLDLSQRTEEQASSLEETASSMEEMTATVKQNSDNTQEASRIAENTKTEAEGGSAVVSKAVASMSEINASSKKIADIISVIDEIAFQTNLLALNAAVEAARAGEQGRGFAVVAGEVRALAGRSAESAKEIKDLITESVSKVEGGTKLVSESGKTLEGILLGAKKVTDIVTEIAASSHEQATGIDQVNKAVMQMDDVTQQNAALVEEAASASKSMEDKVKLLTGLSKQFSE